MVIRDPAAHVQRIIADREIDAASWRWVKDAFRRWWIAGSDPARLGYHFGFQTGARTATAARNRWLLEIADELPLHERAATLKHLMDDFMCLRWPALRHLDQPPNDDDHVDFALFKAARSGARMNLTRHAIGKILRGN